jgi:hypothetical protein
MNVLHMEADIVPSLARDHPHTYEPIASRAPPKALASQAGLASQTRTCMGTLRDEFEKEKKESWTKVSAAYKVLFHAVIEFRLPMK